jgi:hypothetical protein
VPAYLSSPGAAASVTAIAYRWHRRRGNGLVVRVHRCCGLVRGGIDTGRVVNNRYAHHFPAAPGVLGVDMSPSYYGVGLQGGILPDRFERVHRLLPDARVTHSIPIYPQLRQASQLSLTLALTATATG